MLSDKQRHGIHLRRSELPKVLTGLQSEKSEEELFHSRENQQATDLSFRENQQVASTLPNRFACMLSDKQRHGIHLRRSELPKVLTGLQSEKSEEELFHSRENQQVTSNPRI